MGVRVPDPFPIRRDPEQMLGNDQAQQLNGVEAGFTPRVVIAGKAQCGQEGVEVSFYTQGLTPSVND